MCRALPFGQKNTPPALVLNRYMNWKCPGQITKNIVSYRPFPKRSPSYNHS